MKRILIVDDEPEITSNLTKVLMDHGIEAVDAYNDPLVALENFRAGEYSLLLADIPMSKIDGFKLYQEMKRKDNNIRAFFLTALNVNYEVLSDLFSAGGIDVNDESIAAILADTGGRFIRKPIQSHELVTRVKNELRIKRICKVCGWDMDETDPEILAFLHSDCWKEYRKAGLSDPMPENTW